MAHPANRESDNHTLLESVTTSAHDALRAAFDPVNGGFTQPPKSPQIDALDFLLSRYSGSGDREALHMACHTLRRMALSGINDHAGGGFFVRAHDAWWMRPAFEKRTADNARLAMLYVDAWHATGDSLFARIARQTLAWALKEARTAEGAFFTAIGTEDSEEAARYYTWTPEEAERHLEDDEYALVRLRFGLDDKPNLGRRWHLHVYASLSELAKTLHRPKPELEDLLASARDKLWAARRRRPTPSRDERVDLLDNALMVRALARAGRLLETPELLDAAERTLAAITEHLHDGAQQQADNKTAGVLLGAVLELLQARWRDDLLTMARKLASALQRSSTETKSPGAMLALHELGVLLGEAGFVDAASITAEPRLREAAEAKRTPDLAWLTSCEQLVRPMRLALLQGPAAQVEDWRRQAERYFNPARRVYVLAEHAPLPRPMAEEHSVADGGTRAWVCDADRCQGSLETLDALLQALRS